MAQAKTIMNQTFLSFFLSFDALLVISCRCGGSLCLQMLRLQPGKVVAAFLFCRILCLDAEHTGACDNKHEQGTSCVSFRFAELLDVS